MFFGFDEIVGMVGLKEAETHERGEVVFAQYQDLKKTEALAEIEGEGSARKESSEIKMEKGLILGCFGPHLQL